jgi:hypothetical protein
MLILAIAALTYLIFALALVLAIDNMVAFIFPERPATSVRMLSFSKAFAAVQRLNKR